MIMCVCVTRLLGQGGTRAVARRRAAHAVRDARAVLIGRAHGAVFASGAGRVGVVSSLVAALLVVATPAAAVLAEVGDTRELPLLVGASAGGQIQLGVPSRGRAVSGCNMQVDKGSALVHTICAGEGRAVSGRNITCSATCSATCRRTKEALLFTRNARRSLRGARTACRHRRPRSRRPQQRLR